MGFWLSLQRQRRSVPELCSHSLCLADCICQPIAQYVDVNMNGAVLLVWFGFWFGCLFLGWFFFLLSAFSGSWSCGGAALFSDSTCEILALAIHCCIQLPLKCVYAYTPNNKKKPWSVWRFRWLKTPHFWSTACHSRCRGQRLCRCFPFPVCALGYRWLCPDVWLEKVEVELFGVDRVLLCRLGNLYLGRLDLSVAMKDGRTELDAEG